MEKYKEYECYLCGECCRHVNLIKDLISYDRGDGVCKYLDTTNLCKIYDVRPNICNGKYVYEHYFSELTIEEFHELVLKYCDELKKLKKG